MDSIEIEKSKLRLERRKLAHQITHDKRGFVFRSYVLPATTFATAALIAFVGLMSFCTQKEVSKALQTTQKSELELAQKNFELAFVDKQQERNAEARKEFGEVTEKRMQTLSSGTMQERISVADSLLGSYQGVAPNLVIDFFRTFRNRISEETRKNDEGCSGNWELCGSTNSERAKREALMNYVRPRIQGGITVFIKGSAPEKTEIAAWLKKEEGFRIGSEQEPDFAYLDNIAKDQVPGRVYFFYPQDETFAEKIADKLTYVTENHKWGTFGKSFVLESNFRSLRKILIITR